MTSTAEVPACTSRSSWTAQRLAVGGSAGKTCARSPRSGTYDGATQESGERASDYSKYDRRQAARLSESDHGSDETAYGTVCMRQRAGLVS